MTLATGALTDLHGSFPPHHVTEKGYGSVAGDWRFKSGVPPGVCDVRSGHNRIIGGWRVEHDFASRDPIRVVRERRSMSCIIPDDDRLLFARPIHVAGRLVPRRVDWIVFVIGCAGYRVVVLGRQVFGGADRFREGTFGRGDRVVAPRLRSLRGPPARAA